MIEITGAQGKTTTAYALAHLLPGPGILHTSTGTYTMPGGRLLFKKSITPASVLAAAEKAESINGWLVAEESLGVTGAGDLAIITSPSDYRFAAGKKSALAEKIASVQKSRRLLTAPGIPAIAHTDAVRLDDVFSVSGTTCTIALDGRVTAFTSPLLAMPGYRVPLALAGTAAMMLGHDPAPLSTFSGVAGRMSVRKHKNVLVIDNANSGTNVETTVEAARYARACAGSPGITLVIGTVKGDGAVCEGFPHDQIVAAVQRSGPAWSSGWATHWSPMENPARHQLHSPSMRSARPLRRPSAAPLTEQRPAPLCLRSRPGGKNYASSTLHASPPEFDCGRTLHCT